MRKILVSLVVMLSIAGASLLLVPRVSAIRRQENLWQASLVPSSPELCGGFPQNTATRGLDKGVVTVAQSGQVEINLAKLTILASGEIDANKTLDVFAGSFTTGVFQGSFLGRITTDADGNFAGTIDTGGGVPFAYDPGTTVSAQFILNDPGVRSEFITGFTVPAF